MAGACCAQADRLRRVQDSMAQAAAMAGRDPTSVSLLAVSKTFGADAIRVLVAQGQAAFGESYVQEALLKQAQLSDVSIEWHFIGPIQSNKTRPIAEHFSWVHSVDRIKVAERLSAQRPDVLPLLQVCIEVNVSDEPGKAGVAMAELGALADAVAKLPRIRLRGLMAIPAPSDDIAVQRRAFRRVREALDELNARGHALDTLSMGMSADLEAAILEGATIVRVGTMLFGERKTQDA